MSEKPWTSGPRELLEHARAHLKSKAAFDCRIAMISIDNAVELAIRTYLGLPKRVRGADGPSRRDLESAQGFPDLLDLLEKHGGDRLHGIELGDIEWYHRLRNALYHDGNGVTVDPDHVDAYNQVANVLFQNLFETVVTPEAEAPATSLLGEFVLKWATLETRIRSLATAHLPKSSSSRTLGSLYDGLIAKGIVPSIARRRVEALVERRNSVMHSTVALATEDLKHLLGEVDAILAVLPRE